MIRTTGQRTAAVLRTLCSLTLVLVLMQSPALGQDSNADSLKQAAASLRQFQNDLGSMRAAAGRQLGPYQINSSCTWCSEYAWWGFGLCTQNTTQSWATSVDFNWTRERLAGVLKEAEQSAGTFSSRYQPTQAWIDALPGFSARFDATADIMLTVQREIEEGKGPTEQQRQVVTRAVQALSADLNGSSELLQAGTRSLADFLQQQSYYQDSIRAAVDGADQSSQQALQAVQADAARHRCQDGVDQKFAAIRNEFSVSLQEVTAAFQRLEAGNREAQQGQAVLLGAVVDAQTEMQSVQHLLQVLQNDRLGSFLALLHLGAAKKQWQDLAQDFAPGKVAQGPANLRQR